MIRVSLTILCLILTLLPLTARADSFNTLNGKTIFQSKDRAYRLRTEGKPWQLAEQGGLKSTSAQIGQKVFTTFGSKLYLTSDGLRYAEVSSLGIFDDAQFGKVGDQLFFVTRSSGVIEVWQFNNDAWRKTTGLPLGGPEDVKNIFSFNSSIASLAKVGDEVTAFTLSSDGSWVAAAELTCINDDIFTRPRPLAFCDGGASFQLTDDFHWEELFPTNVEGESVTVALAVAFELSNKSRLYIRSESATMTIDIASTEQPLNVTAVGARIILNFPTLGLHELLWREPSPTLVAITTSLSSIIGAENDAELALISAGTAAYVSSAPGQWQSVVAEGEFNHAYRTTNGIFVWETNEEKTSGGRSQYLASGASSFTKVNPWASTTSPVQAHSLDSLPAYLDVITNSGAGNTNLYKSSDYLNWSRVTLPSAPTLSRTIGEIRDLPAGTLFETLGTISVPTGVVGTEIEYAQDETGGIQLYLSQSKGTLSFPVNAFVRITGELSSSAVKRLLLDAPDDVTAEGTGQVVALSLTASNAEMAQGQVANLTDVVSELDTDSLVLGGILKVDLDKLTESVKSVFKLKDRVELAVVIDWNSASSQTEAWYLGTTYKVISREPETETVTAPKTVKSSKASAATKAASTPSSKATTKAAVKTTSSAKPTAKLSQVKTKPVLVEGAKTTRPVTSTQSNELPAVDTLALGILGVIAGMLAMQGRHLRRLIEA